MESRFARQEIIEREDANHNTSPVRPEQRNSDQEDAKMIYKKQLRYHDADEQVISRKWMTMIVLYFMITFELTYFRFKEPIKNYTFTLQMDGSTQMMLLKWMRCKHIAV